MSKYRHQPATPASAPHTEPEPDDMVYCIVIERRGGGCAVSQGEVSKSAVRIVEARQPEGMEYAVGRIVGWIERRWSR